MSTFVSVCVLLKSIKAVPEIHFRQYMNESYYEKCVVWLKSMKFRISNSFELYSLRELHLVSSHNHACKC